MKPRFLFLLALPFINSGVYAQSYFQQEVNFTISVTLNDVSNSLSGIESIVYINNSPDRLKYLFFHLWPNAYKDNNTAFAKQLIENGNTDFYFASDAERGFIDSLDFKADNRKVSFVSNPVYQDICRIDLNEPLLPGDTVIISTPFYVKIPGSFSRFGHVGQSYQISQWYPKPAVYDRKGWNPMPYLDQGEFYSEFGSFDVTITLPENYVVGATGDLQTQSEMEWLNKKVVRTASSEDIPGSSHKLKSIRYTVSNIHDFAWFADKTYRVLKGEIVLSGNRKVTTWAMFPEQKAPLWNNAIEYINDALKYYSSWYGNYPYNNCTAVYGSLQAGGAMEYPTVTVVGEARTPVMLEEYVMHEVGHNWFYGMLGFNERAYPYLDEGINTFSEFRYMRIKNPDLKLYQWFMNNGRMARFLNIDDLPFSSFYEIAYLLAARINQDQPVNLASEAYSENNYGMIVYYKTSLVFTYLLQYLGEEKFNDIMQQFFRNWQFRHPYPDDLRIAFEENCDRDLGWLFDDLIATNAKIDYKITAVKGDSVLVKNSGDIASPIQLTSNKDGLIQQRRWYPGFKGREWLHLVTEKSDNVVLFDSIWLPEINQKNNSFRTHGLLKWVEPINVNAFQIFEKPDRTLVGIFPTVGWNYYNKTLLGVLVYSPLIPKQTLEYQLMPMFGLGNHNFAGMGRAMINLYPESGFLQAMQLSINARRFGTGTGHNDNYNRARGEIMILFRNHSARSVFEKSLRLGITSASQQSMVTADRIFENYFLTLDAGFANHHIWNPYRINFNMEKHNTYLISSLEINSSLALKYASKAIQARIFAAGFLQKDNDFSNFYNIRLSGASGIHDYKFENLYLGRFEDITDKNRSVFLSQQFVPDEGGFVSNIPYATSDRWLVSAGLTIRIPKMPVSVFVNAGTYSGAGSSIWYVSAEESVKSELLSYETGFVINLGEFIKVYFPVATSKDISRVHKIFSENLWQTLRYTIDLNVINPFKLKDQIFN